MANNGHLPRLGVLPAVIFIFGIHGCAARWKPPEVKKDQSASTQPSADRPGFDAYLRAYRLGQWEYERRAIKMASEPTVKYRRVASEKRTTEGNLIERNFLPLTDYLRTGPRGKATADQQRQSMPPLKGGTAFLFELAQPIEPFPEDLTPGEPVTSTTPLRYYDYDGKPLSSGTLTRKVELEGYEDIETPAGKFPACARIRIRLEVNISWMLRMSLESFLWVSAQQGEVRRLQRMSGRFLIFLFSSTYQFDLVEGDTARNGPAPKELAPKWKYGAVLLDRVVPRPRIAGMVVDYANDVTHIPDTAPEDAPPGK